MKLTHLVVASTLAFAPFAVFAQATPTPGQHDWNIHQRKQDQQNRIANGVKDGQLNARQAGHLEHQESAINHEERNMRAQDNGHLTRQDRRTIHRQQNRESRRIYRNRH